MKTKDGTQMSQIAQNFYRLATGKYLVTKKENPTDCPVCSSQAIITGRKFQTPSKIKVTYECLSEICNFCYEAYFKFIGWQPERGGLLEEEKC